MRRKLVWMVGCFGLLTMACSGGGTGGGAGGGSYGGSCDPGNPADPSDPTGPGPSEGAYPSALLGAWLGWPSPEFGQALLFNADGSCVHKWTGDTPYSCTYTVTTGGVQNPAYNQPWIVQYHGAAGFGSLEIIALGPHQLLVRDGQNQIEYERTSNDEVKACVGTPIPCEELSVEQCETAVGCWPKLECTGDAALGCENLSPYYECTPNGCTPAEVCRSLSVAAECIELRADACIERGCRLE